MLWAVLSYPPGIIYACWGGRRDVTCEVIATIVNAVRRFNTEANPDRGARVDILSSEIARLTRERDRLLEGGELPQVSADYMMEGFRELLQLVAALPSDFARVEEAFTAFRTQILGSFRAEDRHAGDVIDDYLRRIDSLMTAAHHRSRRRLHPP